MATAERAEEEEVDVAERTRRRQLQHAACRLAQQTDKQARHITDFNAALVD